MGIHHPALAAGLALLVTTSDAAPPTPRAQPSPDAAPPSQRAPPNRPRAPAAKPAPPGELSALARQLLRRRMERHGADGARLFQAVVTRKRPVVVELARALFTEPRLVRPLPGATDELNAALPEHFFVLEDELRERARRLEKAALSGTDAQVVARFSELTATCVACHSAYLTPDNER